MAMSKQTTRGVSDIQDYEYRLSVLSIITTSERSCSKYKLFHVANIRIGVVSVH